MKILLAECADLTEALPDHRTLSGQGDEPVKPLRLTGNYRVINATGGTVALNWCAEGSPNVRRQVRAILNLVQRVGCRRPAQLDLRQANGQHVRLWIARGIFHNQLGPPRYGRALRGRKINFTVQLRGGAEQQA